MNSPSQAAPAAVRTNFRWIICGLLFFSTTVNYMDRQVISYLKEFFCSSPATGGFGWSNSDFANVTSAFTGFYAGMNLPPRCELSQPSCWSACTRLFRIATSDCMDRQFIRLKPATS